MELMTDEQIEAAGWKRSFTPGSRINYWGHGIEIAAELDIANPYLDAWYGNIFVAGVFVDPGVIEAAERMIVDGRMERVLSNGAAFIAMGCWERAEDALNRAFQGELATGKPRTY